ncbi:MAG: Uma2 family endonuclease [Acidobacteriota bacterium]
MSTKLKHYYTIEDYFSIEAESDIRFEYFQGDIYAMVGGTLEHAQIKDNISENLRGQLKGRGCRVLTSDMRVKTGSDLYTYPDVVALCSKPEIEILDGKHSLLNPSLLVEVLSSSTMKYDKGDKFDHYKTIATLREYVLVDQYKPHVIVHVKQQDGNWQVSECRDISGSIQLPIINCQLAMADVYDMVEFQQGRSL